MDLWITTAEQSDADPVLAAFLLDRLARLVARRHAAIDERQRIAVARCTFSVLLDCRALGLGAEATAILNRDHAPVLIGSGPDRG
jgi:hypothetical protein